MKSLHMMAIAAPLMIALTPAAHADTHFRAMVGGAAALTPGVETNEKLTAGANIQGEAEVYGRFLGLYARGQHLGLVSNIDLDVESTAGDSLQGAATLEQSLLVGPTFGIKAGPVRIRAAAGPVLISSNRYEGTAAEIQDGTASEVYARATSFGSGAELRADFYLPILKPYAAVRGLATSAGATTISGGAYETMDATERAKLEEEVGDRRRVEAVAGLRISILPFIQLGLEGSYGFMGDKTLTDQPWYGVGAGLHFKI